MKTRKVAYYPGCSLHSTAREFDISTRAVCRELGMELEEVPDWNCCGASSAHSINQKLGILLPARNLKLINQQGLDDVIIPCAACFARTKECAFEMDHKPDLKSMVEQELDFTFEKKIRIYHLMELLAKEVGIDEIKQHVKYRLNGLKTVCYYGCLLVRPNSVTELDDKENPQFLDNLMSAIGIDSLDWPYKNECCGASLSLSRPGLVSELVDAMIRWAREAEAQAIVTACPLCQANLEMRQTEKQEMPVFYFTELLGLAFGLPEIGETITRHMIDTGNLIQTLVESAGLPADIRKV